MPFSTIPYIPTRVCLAVVRALSMKGNLLFVRLCNIAYVEYLVQSEESKDDLRTSMQMKVLILTFTVK